MDAKEAAATINERLGWRGADPEFDQAGLTYSGGYTGRVILSARAAAEVARLLSAQTC
jgi:hypothetical protein